MALSCKLSPCSTALKNSCIILFLIHCFSQEDIVLFTALHSGIRQLPIFPFTYYLVTFKKENLHTKNTQYAYEILYIIKDLQTPKKKSVLRSSPRSNFSESCIEQLSQHQRVKTAMFFHYKKDLRNRSNTMNIHLWRIHFSVALNHLTTLNIYLETIANHKTTN